MANVAASRFLFLFSNFLIVLLALKTRGLRECERSLSTIKLTAYFSDFQLKRFFATTQIDFFNALILRTASTREILQASARRFRGVVAPPFAMRFSMARDFRPFHTFWLLLLIAVARGKRAAAHPRFCSPALALALTQFALASSNFSVAGDDSTASCECANGGVCVPLLRSSPGSSLKSTYACR